MTPTPAFSRRTLIALCGVAALGAVAIVGQPVQVDDPLFLAAARQIRQTPLDPYRGKPVWYDGEWFAENANPPLWPYLLAAVSSVCGERLVALQVLQAALNAALVFGVASLARRVTDRPAFWTAAVMLSPFLLPGRNLMADTLFLACWCWSVEFFLRSAATDGGVRAAWIAGVFAAAAILTKYTGGLLLPLFFAATIAMRRPRLAPAFIVPAAAFGLWCLHNLHFYGRTHFGASLAGGAVDWWERSGVFLRALGSLVIWTPALAAGLLATRGRWRWSVVGLAVAGLAAWYDDDRLQAEFLAGQVFLSGTPRALFAATLFSGVAFAVWSIVVVRIPTVDGAERTTRRVLAGWLALAVAFNLAAASAVAFGAVRHLAVAFVPLLLLLARPLDVAAGRSTFVRIVCWMTLFASAGLGGMLAHADCEAGLAGSELRRLVDELRAAGVVKYVGDPAIRYYLESSGIEFWDGTEANVPLGTYLVFTYSRSTPLRGNPVLAKKCGLVQRIPLVTWNRFQTQAALANFYAGNRRTLPWMYQASERFDAPGGGFAPDELLVYRRVR